MVYTLHQLLSEAAAETPERVAIRNGAESLTYGELDTVSSKIAAALLDGGVRRGDRVAVYLPKSKDAVAAVYGIMKVGAAYVPIDPKSPVPRAASIAEDCSPSAIVTTPLRASALLRHAEAFVPRLALLVETDEGAGATDIAIPNIELAEVTSDAGLAEPHVPTIDTDLAYILYTSGSTGSPKGVMLTHRNALTFVEWCASAIGTGADDTFSSHAPLHFDLSIFDLYVAAYGRAIVAIVPEEIAYFGADLATFIRRERITVWYSVPSALMLMERAIPEPETITGLRAVVFAGEVYPTKHLRKLRRLFPEADLWNLYGPTETNVCTYYRVHDLPEDDRPIPIGRACENIEVFAIRDDGARAGIGEEGELYVRGSSVMKGYWGRPEKSEDVLVQSPLSPHFSEAAYRTGDMVRLREDGDYDFLGRRDHQVKSRGYRIELGEVEAAISTHPRVLESVAIAVPHDEWGSAIVAFVVPGVGATCSEIEIKRHVARRLPRYMVPMRVMVVPELPRTSTGKIHRQRLGELVPDGLST